MYNIRVQDYHVVSWLHAGFRWTATVCTVHLKLRWTATVCTVHLKLRWTATVCTVHLKLRHKSITDTYLALRNVVQLSHHTY